MDRRLVSRILPVEGMTCTGCELRIEKKLSAMEGVVSIKTSYTDAAVYVTYDAGKIELERILDALEAMDYHVPQFRKTLSPLEGEKNRSQSGQVSRKSGNEAEGETPLGAQKDLRNTAGQLAEDATPKDKWSINQFLGFAVILLAAYMIIKHTVGFNFIPEINQSMGYGLLFVIGLMTSLHCVAMCGGINLSQCMRFNSGGTDNRYAKLKPSMLYNAGRVVSYTIIGGLAGALGSAVSFSGAFKGVVAILSGAFMIIMGLNMLNIFPWLRRFNPRMPRIFGQKVHSENKRGPFYVGILNGLMPCGPLQAMQIYALGTGSILAGAFSMFMFSLGTVPLMFGLGALSTMLSGRFTKRLMKAGAVLVIVLGVIMAGRGLNLSGVSVFASTGDVSGSATAVVEDGVQTITTDLESGSYPTFVVQKGIPVRWNMKADKKNLNGCNNAITIPTLGIGQKLKAGDNFFEEFTPTEEGVITYTCWMGMIRGNIIVVNDISAVNPDDVRDKLDNSLPPAGSGMGGCCGI